MIHSKQHRGCRIQDLRTRGYRWWKTADFHTARAHSAPVRPPEIPSEFFVEHRRPVHRSVHHHCASLKPPLPDMRDQMRGEREAAVGRRPTETRITGNGAGGSTVGMLRDVSSLC